MKNKLDLLGIKDTVQQVSEAITAALGIDTEIVNNDLEIVGGTGRYISKIGTFEEDGDLDGQYIYAKLLKTGESYINLSLEEDLEYDPLEGEMAEICCPIKYEKKILGLIGLVAFTEMQREKISKNQENLERFIKIMAELLTSKLITDSNNYALKRALDSMLYENIEMTSLDDLIGTSEAIRNIKDRATQVANSDSIILITGESGTGKELLARSIHNASRRARGPFVTIHCAAIPEGLLDSDLFGIDKGFSEEKYGDGKIGKLELAAGGTIFLDEIGDISLHLQVKFLAALQNYTINRIGGNEDINLDVRVMVASNKDLELMIEKNEFLEELYFKLNVIPIQIPPLRDRKEDIGILLSHTLKRVCKQLEKQVDEISTEAMEALLGYAWPGNIRELENVVEYAVNMEEGKQISLKNLPQKIKATPGMVSLNANLKVKTDQFQRQVIMDCLRITGMSPKGKRLASEILGISETALHRKLREFEIGDNE